MRDLLDDIYREHQQALFSLALSVTRHPASAEDAGQAAFTRLLGRRTPPTGDVRAYVFASVRNAAIDQQRRRGRDGKTCASMFEPAESSPPDADVLADEQQRRLRDAIDQLPAPQREAVILKALGGLSHEQVARITGQSPNTVASRYRRALEKLRGALGDEP